MNPIQTIQQSSADHLMQQVKRAKTCNEVAGLLFKAPDHTCSAFLEYENQAINEMPYLELLDLNDDFWARTLDCVVFVREENQFRQYQTSSGLYLPVTEATLIGQLLTNLNFCSDHFPKRLKFGSFLLLKNRDRLKSVVERAKDLLAIPESFFQDSRPRFLNLSNGFLDLRTNQFSEYNPSHFVREKLGVKYDPDAKCELFLEGFLAQILTPEDIGLLQQYCSQLLTGINHSQNILVLTGESGWGKSSLMRMLGMLIGWEKVGIVRDQIFKNEFELGHYADKHLLYHPDMPTQFLNHRGAGIFKQLVGGDPVWAEFKNSDERRVIEGKFPVILACNGKPEICIDQDSDAWLRRFIILNFKKPETDQHLGQLADQVYGAEKSGILNWLLEGRTKLIKQHHQLLQTAEQQARTSQLLLGSESAQAFVRSRLVRSKEGEIGAAELYESYQSWCVKNRLRPFSSRQFHQTAKTELEIGLGLKYRHDLESVGGKARRGWKGLALVLEDKSENLKNASIKSEEKVRVE